MQVKIYRWYSIEFVVWLTKWSPGNNHEKHPANQYSQEAALNAWKMTISISCNLLHLDSLLHQSLKYWGHFLSLICKTYFQLDFLMLRE